MVTGFPYSTFPRGWFQVAWSDEVAPGEVVPLSYFGNELVMFRSESGELAVLSAFCEHLGAHLGHGGTVEGECIVCPFHAWRWDVRGGNVSIPHSSRETQARRVPAWHAVESGGIVALWHDPAGAPPAWGPPNFQRLVGGDYVREKLVWRNAVIQPQFPVENIVDQFHFTPVHLSTSPAELQQFSTEGTEFRSRLHLMFGEGKPPTDLTPGGPSLAVIDVVAHGLGFIDFEFAEVAGTKYIMSTIPIDHERSDIRMSLYLSREQAMDGEQLNAFGAATVREMVKQTDRDLQIFAHWRYNRAAPFTPEETAAYKAIRSWASQFYVAERQSEASVVA